MNKEVTDILEALRKRRIEADFPIKPVKTVTTDLEITSARSLRTHSVRDWVEMEVIGGTYTSPAKKQQQIEHLTELFTRLLVYTANKEDDPLDFLSRFMGDSFYIIIK